VTRFSIHVPERCEPWPHYEESDRSEWGEIFDNSFVDAAIIEWEKKYLLTIWTIEVDGKEYEFFAETIGYVWRDILPWLEQIQAGYDGEITCYAQSNESSIRVEPLDEGRLFLSILTQETEPPYNLTGPDLPLESPILHTHIVEKEQFILEWKLFLFKMLSRLIKEDFLDINDPGLIEYTTQILQI